MTTCSGTLDAWSQHANMLFASGCEAQGFFLLSSFAAPLYATLRYPCAGLVSVWGGKKSGKSVALTAAGSVWGSPAHLAISSFINDERFVKLRELNHMPVIHDGLSHYDPGRALRFVHDAIAGDAMKAGVWRGTFLSVSPVPLLPVFAAVDRPWPCYGVEFEVAVPKAMIDAKLKLEQAFLMNCGHAGERYVAYLAKPDVDRWVRQQVISKRLEIEREFGVEDKAFRYPQTGIAIAHVAGLICVKLGLIDYDPERITAWAATKTFNLPPASAPARATPARPDREGRDGPEQ